MSSIGLDQRLSRAAVAATGGDSAAPPVRIVHLGVGAFHRAHQAWYTQRAADSAEWGISGFTGRSPDVADLLSPQDGLYTLVERAPQGDRFEVIRALARVNSGHDLDAFTAAVAHERTSIVTLTITEAGYRLDNGGRLDFSDPALSADIEHLGTARLPRRVPTTALGRLIVGLDARRAAGAGPIALVSCDNLPDNGTRLADGITALASVASRDLSEWVAGSVSFVSTSVDRITPATDASLIADVREATGFYDAAPVVTEPFTDWVLQGEFPSGRPRWEEAGATFVDDLAPFESRKLWMLNGAHLTLSFMGQLRGYTTIAEAMGDRDLRAVVESLWDEAAANLPDGLDLEAYRRDLTARFLNPRIEHQLTQISVDTVTKLQVRVVPIAEAESRRGRLARGAAATIAAWIECVARGLVVLDGRPDSARTPAFELLDRLSPALARDFAFRTRLLDDVARAS